MSVIADVPDIFSLEFEENPYATYRAMRERAPMLWHERMERFVISCYEDVARACKDPASPPTTTPGSSPRPTVAGSCRR